MNISLPLTFYVQMAVASTGIMLGLLGVVGLLSCLYRRQRQIKYQRRVVRLEQLWLVDASRR